MRSSAAAVTAAEQGVRQGAQYLNLAVKDAIIPSVKSRVPAARGEQKQLRGMKCMVYTSGHIKQIIQQMVHQLFVDDLHATNKVFGGTKSRTNQVAVLLLGNQYHDLHGNEMCDSRGMRVLNCSNITAASLLLFITTTVPCVCGCFIT